MKFKIGFDKSDTKKLHEYWDDIIKRERWTEGYYTKKFEELWAEYCGTKYAVAFGGWSSAARCALEYFDVKGKKVICPSNTFMATPLSIKKAGGRVVFCDCSRNDLCMDIESLSMVILKGTLVFLVHIGGHIAFEVEQLIAMCKSYGHPVIEDCAHAHGALYKGNRAGTFGDCGIYSFTATKTISTGEGGMLVTDNQQLYEFAMMWRNYGKFAHIVEGENGRMSEFNAAIGVVQTMRLDDIVEWKNEYVDKNYKGKYNMVELPDGMISGYYKAITFDEIDNSTGLVYDVGCHRIMKRSVNLPETDWVNKHHWCLPVYYRGDE